MTNRASRLIGWIWIALTCAFAFVLFGVGQSLSLVPFDLGWWLKALGIMIFAWWFSLPIRKRIR